MNRKSLQILRNWWFFASLLTLSSCAGSFEGIKLRGHSPSISEASRRIGLAFRADDYNIEEGSAMGLYHITTWRQLKNAEEGEAEKGSKAEVKLAVRLEPRGTDYDVFLLITIRSATAEYHPPVDHPLVMKWQRLLREIIKVDTRDEG